MSEMELLEELQRLARLSRIGYDQQRRDAAERLGVRLGTLDAEVAKWRSPAAGNQGSKIGRAHV